MILGSLQAGIPCSAFSYTVAFESPPPPPRTVAHQASNTVKRPRKQNNRSSGGGGNPPCQRVLYLTTASPPPPLPPPGPGSAALANLTSRWAALDGDEYPGAGFGTLTPDGRLDPLLAYAYDAVFALAGAIFSVKQEATQWGGVLDGFIADRCACVSRPPAHAAGLKMSCPHASTGMNATCLSRLRARTRWAACVEATSFLIEQS